MLLINRERERELLALAPQPLRDVLIITQDTGLRPDEVLRMRWEYVDWLQKTFLNRCGKTAKARRVVPLSDRALAVLRNRKDIQVQGWVFPTPKKCSRLGHFSLSGIEQQFASAREKAGLPKALVLYCARHTYATDALARTGNVAAVMDAMGHASVQTTMIYQHQGLEHIREAINQRNQENEASQGLPAARPSFGQMLVKATNITTA